MREFALPQTRWTALPLLCLALAACHDKGSGTADSTYPQAVASFYTGVAAVQVGEGGVAEAAFRRVTELAPQEPAGWADLGLVALQEGRLEDAGARLEKARRLAPNDSRVQLLGALVARERGDAEGAKQQLRRAIELDARNLKALYLLAQSLEEESRPESLAEAGQLLDRGLALQPDNVVLLLERARVAARAGDEGAFAEPLGRIAAVAGSAAPGANAQLRQARSAVAAGDLARAATQLSFLQTELEPLAAYQAARAAVVVLPSRTNVLLTSFLRLPAPSPQPAPPDTALAFAAKPLVARAGPWALLRVEWLSDATPVALIAANAQTIWISKDVQTEEVFPFPGGKSREPLTPNAVAPLDYDYDFRVDLALAGDGGLRLLHQEAEGKHTDVTATAIPAAMSRGAYAGVWAADLDMDGDVDLVIARRDGPPIALSNRADGKFEPRPGFEGSTRLRDFVWADLDADGDPDAVLLDADGGLRVYRNQRAQKPQFAAVAMPAGLGQVQAVAAADLDQDATLDLVVLRLDGTLSLLSLAGDAWKNKPLAQWTGYAATTPGAARLLVADLDNNGAPDLVVSTPAGTRVWLSTPRGLQLRAPISDRITSVADLTNTGRLDLLGVSPQGGLVWLANQGKLDYYSTTIRPRAASATGDRRINPFGIGGEIEVRAGLLYQKQPITTPWAHFGLGMQKEVNVARIIWPNGASQADFNVTPTTQAMLARQRLKGSCPWVFAFDGKEMRYVTDFIWRTALGLRINTQGPGVLHSEDWVKIRGDQLQPRDGYYDIRVTAELWESHFFDHIALMVVDHPVGTDVWVDERFTLPPPPLKVEAMGPLQPLAGAWDQDGHDVTAAVRELDERFLDSFKLGPYQGIAQEHDIELAIPDNAPRMGPLWLVASGWLHPTDATVNVAVMEGGLPRPHGLRLEVADGRGGWVTVVPDLGIPSGRTKTILIDLQHVFRPGAPRRLRLWTNSEIYWDRISWAAGQPDTPVRTRRMLPSTAEIRFRGFSVVHQPKPSDAEIPDYNHISTTTQRWRDLIGYYTRYGDVRPLNEKVDDRYVIMNAGDEIALRFAALPQPPAGWTRDFVLIGDGWAKDGDLNTGYSKTLVPLPYHGLTEYSRPPGRLEDDPGYRRHPDDWKLFHTRYVEPQEFQRALAPQTAP